MIFQVTFKTPDVFQERAVEAAALKADQHGWRRDEEEWTEAYLDAIEEASVVEKKFVLHGEYVTVEFNTTERTARVIQQGRE